MMMCAECWELQKQLDDAEFEYFWVNSAKPERHYRRTRFAGPVSCKSASTLSLPVQLGATQAIRDSTGRARPVPLRYVSPKQIEFLMRQPSQWDDAGLVGTANRWRLRGRHPAKSGNLERSCPLRHLCPRNNVRHRRIFSHVAAKRIIFHRVERDCFGRT